ncbi:programmed cell death protein 1 [Anolis sagrei]|uniref:programmed cell death protein 1 n=1 Tax=Anolis sagrei TaxID=38937 RepID=UPI003521ECFF
MWGVAPEQSLVWKGPQKALEMAMESQHRVVPWVGAWLLLLCCRSALLLSPSATFWPTQLNQWMGTTAEFTCNISNAVISEDSVIWYKFDASKQPVKLDPSNKNKYNITRLGPQTFRMRILNLERNDSGLYCCKRVAILTSHALTESNYGNLTVTEIVPTSGSPEDEYKKDDDDDDDDGKENENVDHQISLTAIGVLGLVLVLVLASLCFFLIKVIRRRQERGKPHDENAPLEAEPPAVAVFTVDYGVLEFQARKNFPPPSPKPQPLDQTEYATIIFPTEKPEPMKNTKRTKKQVRWVPTSRQQLH